MSTVANGQLKTTVYRIAFLLGSVCLIYYGKSLLIPLVIAALLSLMLHPLQEWLRRKGWRKGWSIAACLLSLILFFGGIAAVVSTQAVKFVQDWPEIQQNINKQVTALEDKVGQLPGFTPGEGSSAGAGNSFPLSINTVRSTLGNTLSIAGNFLLMLVYVVLLLAEKNRLYQFVLRRASDASRSKAQTAINDSRDVAINYLKGRLILIGVLSICYAIGFTVSGIKYGLLLAVLAAILSVIPYLGNIIGGGIALVIVFANGGGTTQMLGIIITMSLVQPLESYVLTPMIFKEQVDINPLSTIISVVGFGLLWGAIGAVVAIPLVAILRVVGEKIEPLQDFAYLLGTK
ncbi:MAG: AI-2E family transporter [Bacteroidota bacterium]